MSTWKKYGETLPPFGEEVLAYNSKWVNKDFNPTGIRAGFRMGNGEVDSNGFLSAKWDNEYDSYDESYDIPEYWTEMPKFELK